MPASVRTPERGGQTGSGRSPIGFCVIRSSVSSIARGVMEPGVSAYGRSKKAITTRAAEAMKSGATMTRMWPQAGFERSAYTTSDPIVMIDPKIRSSHRIGGTPLPAIWSICMCAASRCWLAVSQRSRPGPAASAFSARMPSIIPSVAISSGCRRVSPERTAGHDTSMTSSA